MCVCTVGAGIRSVFDKNLLMEFAKEEEEEVEGEEEPLI